MTQCLLLVFAFLALLARPSLAADTDAGQKYDTSNMSYCVGYQLGENLKASELAYSIDDLMKGLEDAMNGGDARLDPKERQLILMEMSRRSLAAKQKKRDERGTDNAWNGRKFLDANKAAEGVVTLPSGLQYKVIKDGAGNQPRREDSVTVHYRGTLIDGTEFDNSRTRNTPATFRVSEVIRGWTEALQLMKEGSTWRIFVPPDLAYGDRGFGSRIPPGSTLIFDIELLKIDR